MVGEKGSMHVRHVIVRNVYITTSTVAITFSQFFSWCVMDHSIMQLRELEVLRAGRRVALAVRKALEAERKSRAEALDEVSNWVLN